MRYQEEEDDAHKYDRQVVLVPAPVGVLLLALLLGAFPMSMCSDSQSRGLLVAVSLSTVGIAAWRPRTAPASAHLRKH